MKTAIIIGGGIAGCSTAYALAKRGVAVTLIERHSQIAQEASGNPVAMLYPKFSAVTNVQNTLAVEGFSYTLRLLKQLPNHQFIHALCGQIQLAFNAREAEKQATLLRTASANALSQRIQHLSSAEASEVTNLTLATGGIYLADAGWVKPTAFCHALIKSPHIKTITAAEALSITHADNVWQVSTENAMQLAADIIVICNANDILQFEQCRHIPVTPVRGQVNFFAENTLSKTISNVICTDHYLSPTIDGVHSIGTSYAPNDLNPTVTAADTQANLSALHKISPALAASIDHSKLTGRVAWRSATRDYLPLAGQLIMEASLRKTPPRYDDNPIGLPWQKGLYMNAGHGSKGMITAPLCGELVANQICNEPLIMPPTMASTLNPSRFLLRELGLKKMAQNLYPF